MADGPLCYVTIQPAELFEAGHAAAMASAGFWSRAASAKRLVHRCLMEGRGVMTHEASSNTVTADIAGVLLVAWIAIIVFAVPTTRPLSATPIPSLFARPANGGRRFWLLTVAARQATAAGLPAQSLPVPLC